MIKKPKSVPNDEWLLAIGLASLPEVDLSWVNAPTEGPFYDAHRIARAVSGAIDGMTWSGAYDGAGFMNGAWPARHTHGEIDAYAAGAALAMALEAGHE